MHAWPSETAGIRHVAAFDTLSAAIAREEVYASTSAATAELVPPVLLFV
jgi:hypothetical protein